MYALAFCWAAAECLCLGVLRMLPAAQGPDHAGFATWELVDPVVADPVAQDNEKRNKIQTYT